MRRNRKLFKQLTLIDEIEQKKKETKPYRNGLGELLPWEEPEYLKTLIERNHENS